MTIVVSCVVPTHSIILFSLPHVLVQTAEGVRNNLNKSPVAYSRYQNNHGYKCIIERINVGRVINQLLLLVHNQYQMAQFQ